MARSQGDKIFLPGGVTGDKSRWRSPSGALEKWKEGRTGDQLVDANMRELRATGFMSNRGRQNVASYLIFDLGVDWRYGASHFEEHLLDHDPCSNWGNWVAAAGLTGQRVNKFNTKKQLNDYDPGREYVRHWLEGRGPVAARAPVPMEVDAVDDEEAKKLQARAERFGLGKGGKEGRAQPYGKGRGKGYSGAGVDSSDRKQGRWRKMEPPLQAQGA